MIKTKEQYNKAITMIDEYIETPNVNTEWKYLLKDLRDIISQKASQIKDFTFTEEMLEKSLDKYKNIMAPAFEDMDESEIEELEEYLLRMEFFSGPSSTIYHGAYPGGNFDHSYTVTEELLNLTEKLGLTWQRKRSPYIIGMFHDLCKASKYNIKNDLTGYEYAKPYENEHGTLSVRRLSQILKLTEEEEMCIAFHMGAYETKQWNEYDKAIRKYPNVLYVHTADMIASKIRDV